jgi:hypothetical protein
MKERNHEQTEKGIFGEEAINEIAYKTYLKYWCYASPKDNLGDKKEICDLLILFKNTAIIVSVKNYSFKGNYERYFRSTLDKATLQINGAEKKLFNNRTAIRFSHPDLGEIQFEPSQFTHVLRVIININNNPLFYPGTTVTQKGNLVHVFNYDSFLKTVLELDTIPDFISYLRVREDAFQNKSLLFLTGEENHWNKETGGEFSKVAFQKIEPQDETILISGTELDLLADYYFHERKFSEQIYSKNGNLKTLFLDGNWNNYLEKEKVKRKKQADKASYFVDEFVKREVLYKAHGNNLELATDLLSFSRFERRMIGIQFFEAVKQYGPARELGTFRKFGTINDTIVGFIIHHSSIPQEIINKMLSLAIEGHILYDGYKSKKIIVIAFGHKGNFSYGYQNEILPFPNEYEDLIREDLKKIGWFSKHKETRFNFKEYPDE